jgi:cathepsin H
MSKFLTSFLILSACLASLQAERQFTHFTKVHSRSYSAEEYHYRKGIFEETLKKIDAHNSDPTNKWTKGVTEYADWTEEEFAAGKLQAWQNCSATQGFLGNYKASKLGWIPASVDWRQMGVVTPVKNQGKCGSCWTFSTTGAMESHWAIRTQKGLPLLSEQQLVDCAGAFNNFGCNGGLPSQAFEYIMYNGGITSEDQYPYTAVDGTCLKNFTNVAYAKGGSNNITYLDEFSLQHAVAFEGPVSIAFQVITGFKDYTGGVYSSPLCSNLPSMVNHAVLAVGYGVASDGEEYYIVKNSWGATWGMQGYFYLQRGTNMCGVADCASFPNIYSR